MKFQNIITGQWIEATDWQLALKAGDFYCIEQPQLYAGGETSAGPTIYGQIITNTPEDDEPLYRPGFFLVRGFSQWCPKGELGEFCIADATRQLSHEEFERARAAGWTIIEEESKP